VKKEKTLQKLLNFIPNFRNKLNKLLILRRLPQFKESASSKYKKIERK